jgi:hypothetical protein
MNDRLPHEKGFHVVGIPNPDDVPSLHTPAADTGA